MAGPSETTGAGIADAGGPNQDQVEYWNSDITAQWVTQQEHMDRLLAPLTGFLLDHVAAKPGEAVIDVGCGCGATALALARRVGTSGSVLGVDISHPMLGRARERAESEGLRQLTLVNADASLHPFDPSSADLVVSRFGVMFFRNPEDAFANLRRAARPSGRIVFMAWRPLSENPWFAVPLAVARTVVPDMPTPPGPDEPGPFAFADGARVERILTAAGWHQTDLQRRDAPMRLGEPGGASEAAGRSVRMGPVARALKGASDELRARVARAIEARLAEHDSPEGISLPGAVWIVSARAS